MSTSYIGYKAIDKGYVDWASAAKDLNATLEANRKEKQTKRKELEDATRETINKLGNYQAGRSQTANNIFYDFADNSKTAIFELNKQLKSGNLSYNDYKKSYQNLQDGTAEIKKNLATWNAEYESIRKGQESINGKPPEDSAITLYMAQNHGSLLDIQNSMFYTDPVNLRVYHAKAGENGVPAPGSLRDVLTINNRENSRVKRVDIQSRLDEFTPEIAKYEFIGTTTGRKISDPTVRDNFQKFRADTIKSIASNDRAMASILFDSSSKEYKLASDISEIPEGAREDYILLGYDGNSIIQPQLTEKQREFAKQTVGNAFDVRVERGVTETAESRAKVATGISSKQDDATFKLYVDAAAGDRASLTSIINRPDSKISNVVSPSREEASANPEEAKIRVFDKNKKEYESIDFYKRDRNGNLIQQKDSEGNLLTDASGNPVYFEKTNLEIGKELMNISGITISTIEDIEAKYSPRQIGAGFGDLPEPSVTGFDDKTAIAGEIQPSASEAIDEVFEENEMPTEPSGISGLVGGITGESSKYKQNLRNRANTITSAISNEFARKVGVTPQVNILGNGEQAEFTIGNTSVTVNLANQAGTQKTLRKLWTDLTSSLSKTKPSDEVEDSRELD